MTLGQNDRCDKEIAYFSMEVGLANHLPTYSGGLGVLAGDTLKSAADGGLPLLGVTLLYRKGYFKQTVDKQGRQAEEEVQWRVEDVLTAEPGQFELKLEGRSVHFRVWRYDVEGATGHVVPVYFLDSDLEGNQKEDRALSHHLYGGDEEYRLRQEALLGMGGIAFLRSILADNDAFANLNTFHMNEGHAALLTIALLQEELGSEKALSKAEPKMMAAVKRKCVFTTHTPVPAGHDRFPTELVEKVLGREVSSFLTSSEIAKNGELNMTQLALRFARYTNGVAKRHGEVSRQMFPGEQVQAITNGVHLASWVSEPVVALYDRFIPFWREDNHYLRYACEIPLEEVDRAHSEAKAQLLAVVKELKGIDWDKNTFTIGFARRAATYKRADLLLEDPARLAALANKYGKLQVVYAGKAHPRDDSGKQLIHNVVARASGLERAQVEVVYLENYDMELGRLITGGVDLWLNNPVKPLEASGTSGMKAAASGVPSLSTLDGWWVEGFVDGVTGWEIADTQDGMATGVEPSDPTQRQEASNSLYSQLENVILPMYYERRQDYLAVRRHSMALNGSYFNTQRMVEQYRCQAYKLTD